MSKVLVCGGRDYANREHLWEVLTYLRETRRLGLLIEGGSRGADRLANRWAWSHGTLTWTFPADWQKYGKAAGAIRNQQMLDEGQPDLVVAFPGGAGTADMVSRARRAGVEVIEVTDA